MQKIILFTFCVFLCNSCKKEHKASVINSFEFNTGMVDFSFRYIGLYEQDGKEYLYFVDKEKDIKIFGFDGKLFDSIPLRNLIYEFATKRDKIRGNVQFVGKDSILLKVLLN